ncbi:MAG: pyridoxamine kinase [Coriobacteriia bacterium]|nr:pyridoxamine kinase [Coriobacteriia bacterium]
MKIKRVAAVHDLSGYGKCSLTIAIPVLSSFGIEVCPIPTGIFSMHTALDNWKMLDTADFIEEYIDSWKRENIQVDAIYSGFLTNQKQADIIKKLYRYNESALRFVDPVMGDNGKLYKTYDEELVESMRNLVSYADIATPNLTEAEILTKTKENILEELHNMGAKNIVLTSNVTDDTISNFTYDGKTKTEFKYKYYDEQIHGTGDLFSSCVLGMYLNGFSLNESVKYASEFTLDAIELTKTQDNYSSRGVSFEPLLGKNTAMIRDKA